jgi:transcription initiation factor TFIIE subunit beta
MNNVSAELAKFRQQQAAAGKVLVAAAKEREQRLKGQGAKKAAARPPRPTKSRAAASASAASDGPSTSAPKRTDVRSLPATKDQGPPIGQRLKRVLDHLRAIEAVQTAAQIKAAVSFDLSIDSELAEALDRNPKVGREEESEAYFYRPDANVRDRRQLLEYVRRAAAPVAVSEVADAYKSVREDIDALKKEGLIMGLHSFDPLVACEVLYPVDQRLAGVAVDDEVAALWHAAEVPEEDDEVEAALRKAGMEPIPRKAPSRQPAAERKKKKRRQTRLRAVTNVHLMHLLEGEGPTSIEEVPMDY